MKLLTVAIPSYNSADYMGRAIESLLPAGDQIEILVIDDGSKDETLTIAQDYQRRYPDQVKAIHQANKGHGGAVNTGLAHATGQYFKVVDSDDWVDESALAAVMATLERFEAENTQVDVLLTNYVYEQG